MKRYSTLLIILFFLLSQKSIAQVTPALVNNITIGYDGNSKFHLTWDVAVNETIDRFEVEKSINGIDFTSIGIVLGSGKRDAESYKYSGSVDNNEKKIMYRLKIINTTQRVSYSKIITSRPKTPVKATLRILGNPVINKLAFTYNSTIRNAELKILDMSGEIVFKTYIYNTEANIVIIVDLNNTLKPGLYVISVNNGMESQTAKFIKQ